MGPFSGSGLVAQNTPREGLPLVLSLEVALGEIGVGQPLEDLLQIHRGELAIAAPLEARAGGRALLGVLAWLLADAVGPHAVVLS